MWINYNTSICSKQDNYLSPTLYEHTGNLSNKWQTFQAREYVWKTRCLLGLFSLIILLGHQFPSAEYYTYPPLQCKTKDSDSSIDSNTEGDLRLSSVFATENSRNYKQKQIPRPLIQRSTKTKKFERR